MKKWKSKYTKNFFNIEENLDNIIKTIDDYNFYDALMAVYCINICINNRSILCSQMKLNLGLKLCNKKGTSRIKTYNDFKLFFNKLKPYITPDAYDDPILEDFGDIKFIFDSEIYNVIIGTGYNSSYAQLFFLEPLALLTESKDIIKKILRFSSDNIEFFKETNISDKKEKIRLILPTNNLYKRVKEYFNNLDFVLTKEINDIIETKNNYIENVYFLLYEEKYYPLYNTAILTDLYDTLYKKLSDDQKNIVADNGIISLLSKISRLDQGEIPYLYFPIKLRCNISDINAPIYTFLGRTKNGSTIIAINKSFFKNDEELKKEIDQILSLQYQDNLEFIETRKRSKEGLRGIKITNKSCIKFILYNNYTNLTEEYLRLGSKTELLECSALDMIYLIAFSDGLDEIDSYLDYDDEKEYDQMISFGGDSSRFFTWKVNYHMIAKGAVRFGMISTDLNTADGYVLDYYRNILKNFPWGSSNKYLFDQPFSWSIEKVTDNLYLYKNKIIPTYFGYATYFCNNQLCFFAHNLLFWDKDNIDKADNVIDVLNDLIMRKAKTCFNYIQSISTTSKKSLYFLFLPFEYAKSIGMNVSDETRLVYGDFIEDEQSLNIRYTINAELLFNSINKSSDRTVENKFVRELFEPIKKNYPIDITNFNNYLNETNKEKKEVDVIQLNLDYIYDNSSRAFDVETYDYLMVRKKIAEICFNNSIAPGEYFGKKANEIIRKMQKQLIKQFEELISKYNQKDLHIKLLEMYSRCTHEIFIHRRRYTDISDLTDDVLNDVRSNIIEQRETAKKNARTLLYLIESNLYLNREINNIIADEELRFLLAFSNWLVVLNDTADLCYFTSDDAHIEVNYEYVVDNIDDNAIDNADDYAKRIYSKNGYFLKYDSQDNIFFEKVREAFDKETGRNLMGIFDICLYLQSEFLDYEYEKLSSNVYKITIKNLIEGLSKIVNSRDGDNYPAENIEKNLELLIINPKYLKTRNGKEDYYLPFNEREKRDCRFEIKPIIKTENDLIFSPVLMKNVCSLWFEGINNFMLPYEIGLTNTRNVILEWKKTHENRIVHDIKKIFEENGISFVNINVKLHKIDKKEKYPNNLGDYDVIAIDDVRKNMWIIESKFLNKVGSIYESFDQQRNFFIDNDYIDRFQKRINFMDKNYKRVLRSYGFFDVTGFKVIPYMVFNKVMVSRYRKVNFPLISIMELEDEIKKYN